MERKPKGAVPVCQAAPRRNGVARRASSPRATVSFVASVRVEPGRRPWPRRPARSPSSRGEARAARRSSGARTGRKRCPRLRRTPTSSAMLVSPDEAALEVPCAYAGSHSSPSPLAIDRAARLHSARGFHRTTRCDFPFAGRCRQRSWLAPVAQTSHRPYQRVDRAL